MLNGVRIDPSRGYEVQAGHRITVGKTLFIIGNGSLEEEKNAAGHEDTTTALNAEDLAPLDQDRPLSHYRNMELLYKISITLMGSLNVPEIFRNIIDYVFDLLKRIDRVAFILLDPDTEEILDVVSSSKQDTTDTYCLEVVKRVMEDRRVVAVSNVQAEKQDELVDTLKILKIESVMCVPMLSHSRLIGLIYVDSLGRPYGFRKEDLPLFMDLSQMTALAVEKSRLSSESAGGTNNLPLDS